MKAGFFLIFATFSYPSSKRLMKPFLFGALFFGTIFGSDAQKFAYVDTDYILEKIPAYQSAQKKLDQLSKKWQKEIEQKYQEIKEMKREFEAEKVLLTEEMKQKRKAEIREKQKKVEALKEERFGKNGKLAKKRKELIQPIQDRIYSAIKDMADSRRYMVIFDKGRGSDILYGNDQYDKSDRILKKLGHEP